jgi:hypothetical protein
MWVDLDDTSPAQAQVLLGTPDDQPLPADDGQALP